ncbi:MAG: hypothetical protein HYZ28_19280 [Myxococcales bacterium]|nr:hypothetical protein [Myxococcales bacterium]
MSLLRAFTVAILPLLAAASPLAAAAKPRLRLLSSVDGGPNSADWKYARVGQQVLLHAELTGANGASLRWFKLEPTVSAVDNTTPRFHFASIPYARTEIPACRGQATCPADVAPSRLPEVAAVPGAGTMAFQVTASLPGGVELATAGLESVESGGLGRAVHRVTFRRDDSYLGYLTELFNTPYIFGSSGPPGRNQTDLLIGSDCADLAIYGRRRMGRVAEYTSSFGIDRQAPEVARALGLDARGVALDATGSPLRWNGGKAKVTAGDLLHFPSSRHVAVLYEDREPFDVLDSGDLMLHTCWAPPTVQPIGDSSCASTPIRVLRFPER